MKSNPPIRAFPKGKQTKVKAPVRAFAAVAMAAACVAGVMASPTPTVASPMQSPVAPTRIYQQRLVLVMSHYDARRDNVLGTECDLPFIEGPNCPVGYIEQAPTGWIRLVGADWRSQEPTPGVYDFSSDDTPARIAGVHDAIAHGLRPILVVRTVPDWASARPGVPCGPIASQYYAAFGHYVNAVIDAFGVQYVEVWNEPDAQVNDGNGYIGCWPSGKSYTDMLRVVYPMVKAAHPGTQIIAGAIAGDPSSTWMQQAIKAGIGRYSDIVSFHAYQWYPATAVVSHDYAVKLHAMLPGKPLMLSEGALAAGTNTVTPQIRAAQATYLQTMMRYCESDSLVACIWFRAPPIDWFHTELIEPSGPNAVYAAFSGFR